MEGKREVILPDQLVICVKGLNTMIVSGIQCHSDKDFFSMIQLSTCHYSSTPAIVSAAVEIHVIPAHQNCENRLCAETSHLHFDCKYIQKSLFLKRQES